MKKILAVTIAALTLVATVLGGCASKEAAEPVQDSTQLYKNVRHIKVTAYSEKPVFHPVQQSAQMFRFPMGLPKAQATVLLQLITVKRLYFFLEIAMKTAWETVIVNG